MCSQQEKYLLQDAVKTMMAQICKVGVTYQSELHIEGTVVVTADQQKVIVIHFDDHLPLQSTAQPTQTDNSCVNTTPSQDAAVSDGCRFGTGDVSNLATNRPCGITSPGSYQAAKSGWYEGSSSSKMMNSLTELDDAWNDRAAIELDSEPDDADSRLVNTPNYGDNNSSFGHGDSIDDVALIQECQTSANERKVRRIKDGKNVIVIEDNDLFRSARTLHETVGECTSAEMKQLSGRSSTFSIADCESVGDTADLRSLSNDCTQEVETDISGLRSAVLACEICGWHARTSSNLESHLVSQHDVTESERLGHCIKTVSCPVCSKRFRFRTQLSKHMAVHSARVVDRPYRCQICRNSYRYAQSLALHLSVHDKSLIKGRRLNCTLCCKTYPNKMLFQKHIMYMHERVNRK